MNSKAELLPQTVLYVKNGQGGTWWREAKEKNQVHFGWKSIPQSLMRSKDFTAIETLIRSEFKDQGAATRDFNQLCHALKNPSRHIWVTIEDGYLWWTTVKNQIFSSSKGETLSKGHFWLMCGRPWQNTSVTGKLLAVSNLPGRITMTAGFRSTICVPQEAAAMRRVILGEVDREAMLAAEMRTAYEQSLEHLIQRLSAKDFELLIDLILARTGWVRTSLVGKSKEGVDIEAENIAAGELAFVQVKSSADQTTLLDYIQRYETRTDNYDRMIMAAHSPEGVMKLPETASKTIQLWTCDKIAQLSVRLGIGSWIETRLA